jgi:anti-anti-sigma factor
MVRTSGDISEILVAGELDLSTCPLLEEKINEAFAARPGTLVVDLQDVTFIDSSTIKTLLLAQARIITGGSAFFVRAAGGPVERLLELCGLGAAFDVPPAA